MSTGDYEVVSGGITRTYRLHVPEKYTAVGDENKQAWQGAPYSAAGVDDVKFTADLLDKLEGELCVDTDAVYAAGKSNGAGFTAILACELADRIAAIAPVAGAFYQPGKRCAPSRPVPVLDIHGTGDTTIPSGGDVSATCRVCRPGSATGRSATTATRIHGSRSRVTMY
ncbi:alpha/beta hydrolase family esterase [Kribbella sp. NPDC049174]|uniref:alpha/beta hydrolase family esterase n=1 Tax=Kribbella sp. NPDC049174 TaxID=3364112 RepID=UPI0037149C18